MDPEEDSVIEVQTEPKDGSAQVLVNMEALIKNHVSQIDKLQDEAKKYKQMLDDIFANDPTYQEHDKKAKEASKVRQTTRAQILKMPQAADLSNKVKSTKSQVKELQMALSDYLQEFQRLSGVNEIEGEDGEMREIVYEAKLIKKSSIFK